MVPTRVGQKFEGGYFTGVIRIGTTCYAIIVAPKSTQVLGIAFKTSADATANTQSVNDGWTNTNSINNSFHPAAQYCLSMAVRGYTDWYLPSRDELELCYRNLKPTVQYNATYTAGTYTGNIGLADGANPSSIPAGTAYTRTNITQTNVTTFRTGGVEAFDSSFYWTSTEYSVSSARALIQYFGNGHQGNPIKTFTDGSVRAVRRVLIAQGNRNDTD